MKCPNDEAVLVMSERSGIEIDYCPECRGVWLDRGELDKIIERSNVTETSVSAVEFRSNSHTEKPRHYEQYDDRKPNRKKRRGSFLEDLFEFGE